MQELCLNVNQQNVLIHIKCFSCKLKTCYIPRLLAALNMDGKITFETNDPDGRWFVVSRLHPALT